MEFEGVLGMFEEVWGVEGGLLDPCRARFAPRSLLGPLLNLVPNTIKWSNWPMFKRQASLTNFWTFGAPRGARKRPFYEQIKPV